MTQVSKIDYRVVLDTLSSIDHPRALTVAILFRHQEFNQIVSLNWDPFDYNSLEDARSSFQATELLRKSDFLPTNIDKDQVAFEGFIAAEESCRMTNERLLQRNADVEPILYGTLRKIADVLGHFDADEWLDLSGWGPGVTLTLRGGNATYFRKFRHDGEATPAFARLLPLIEKAYSPHWKLRPRLYEGNRVITVPKNAKTNRVIAVEPSYNLYFQKGIGEMIKRRLKRWGVDLKDQSVNQNLARSGSHTGQLATVDFSAASDTVSYMLVRELLPPMWYYVLDALRSPRGVAPDGSLVEYEKFSSMGNGFTFELESLIFWALAKAIVPSDHRHYDSISVFGDDVIIPSEFMERYSVVCRHLGFTVNTKKSYSTSYFRESCGGYYWNGVSIAPARMERSVSSVKEKMSFHNRLYEYDSTGWTSPVFSGVRALLVSAVEKPCFVPYTMGDSGFWSPTPRNARYSVRHGGWSTKAHLSSAMFEEADDSAVMLSHLYFNMDDRVFSHSIWLQELFGTAERLAQGNTCAIPRRSRRRINRLRFECWCEVPVRF